MFRWASHIVAFLKSCLYAFYDSVVDISQDMPGMAQTFERTLIKDFMYASLSFAGPGVKPSYVSAQLNIRPGFLQTPRAFRALLDERLAYTPRIT